jgi:hypothetical protein
MVWGSISQNNLDFEVVDDSTFNLTAADNTSTDWLTFLSYHNPIRTGKHRLEFDLTLNSGAIDVGFVWNYTDTDEDPNDGNSSYSSSKRPVVGHNSWDFEIFNDGVSPYPHVFFQINAGSTFDISVTNFKITHEPSTVTADHTAVPKAQSKETTFGGSKSITVNRDIEPLLSKVVGGAAAAYSLRDLNDSQGNNNVVRVRRESDNSEKDFLAKELSNGTLTRWVNEQPTLPLDLRELDTNTGERDGALIEAAAAYSLRKLKEDFTGDVVEVRRNVDGETEGFTDAEVTDGTLEGFVKGEEVIYESDFSAGEDGWIRAYPRVTIEGNIDGIGGRDNSLKIMALEEGSPWFGKQGILRKGARYKVSYEFYTEGNFGINLVSNGYASSGVSNGNWVSYEADFISDNNFLQFIRPYNDYPAYIRNVKIISYAENELPLDQATGAAAAYSLRNLSSSGTDVTATESFSFTGADGDSATYNGVLFTADGLSNGKTIYYTSDRNASIGWATAGYWTLFASTTIARSSNSTDDYPWQATWGGQAVGDDDDLNDATFNTNTGKYVVQTRRSSDDAVKSFTASEVADGTLEDWVTASLSNGVFQNNGYETYSGASESGFSATNTTMAGFATSTIPSGVTGNKLKVSFDIVVVSGSPKIALRATTGTGTASNILEMTTSGSHTVTLTATGSYSYVGFSEGDAPSDFTVSNFQIIGQDGHVKTWYDQSGSDNHSVQTDTAKQPKIVNDGTYLEEVDFDGTQHFEKISGGILTNIQDTFSTFVGTRRNSSQGYVAQASAAGGTSPRLYLKFYSATIGAEPVNVQLSGINDQEALFTLEGLSGVYNGYKNGANTAGPVTTATTGANAFTLGASSSGNSPLDGKLKEFIIYDSDQSDKRRAIEENIANHYDISLAAFSRDGTVSTWYDQSGSTPANHATQTDPTKQPKIVVNGSLVQKRNKPSIKFADDSSDERYLTSPADIGSSFSFFASWQPLADDVTTGSGAAQKRNSTLLYGSGSLYIAGINSDFTNGYKSGAGADSYSAGIDFQKSLNLHTIIEGSADINYFGNGTNEIDGSGDASTVTATKYYIGSKVVVPTHNTRGYISELIHYNTDQSDNRTAIEANIGETYGITDIPAADDTVNGFVQTWYDQSGSGNDAEQISATKQPKIVGEVTSGQPHAFLGAIEFDGDDDFIKMDSEVTLGTEFYVPMVVTAVSADSEANATFVGSDSSGGGNRLYLATSSNKLAYRNNSTNYITNLIVSATDVELVSYLATSSNFTTSLNGTDDVDAALAGSMGAEYIGGGTDFNLAASFREIIIYASDQSANRPAIEANINNQYDIY